MVPLAWAAPLCSNWGVISPLPFPAWLLPWAPLSSRSVLILLGDALWFHSHLMQQPVPRHDHQRVPLRQILIPHLLLSMVCSFWGEKQSRASPSILLPPHRQ